MQESGEGFEVFVAVVEAGSIAAASRVLGEPRETLSRQVSRLERRLGVRLLHRGPRALTLSEAGRVLYERAATIVEGAREAELAVQRLDGQPRGRVRVSVPPRVSDFPILEMALAFLERYPEVELELTETDRFVDLVAEGFDVAFRGGRLADSGLIVRKLWEAEKVAAASPLYLERRGRPETPAELSDHNCIVGMAGGRVPERTWPLRGGGRVAVSGRLVMSDYFARVRAATAGFGVAMIHSEIVDTAAAVGRLEAVLPDHIGLTTQASLVYVERELMPPKLRAFIDFTVDWFKRRTVLQQLDELRQLVVGPQWFASATPAVEAVREPRER